MFYHWSVNISKIQKNSAVETLLELLNASYYAFFLLFFEYIIFVIIYKCPNKVCAFQTISTADVRYNIVTWNNLTSKIL